MLSFAHDCGGCFFVSKRNDMIRLGDALNLMEEKDRDGAPQSFAISFVTLDRKKKTGGQIRHIKRAVKTGLPYKVSDNSLRGVRDLDAGSHPVPVHIRLITEFNNQPVVY